jgi:CHAT domain-containing protein
MILALIIVAAQLQSELVVKSRANPVAAREAITEALHGGEIATARRLAEAYALAFQDSFPVRDVDRFSAWNVAQRASRVWTDSARRAGIATYARDGADAAIRVWRRALSRARTVPDTAGMAALLGNIGAAHLDAQRLDSAAASCARARTLSAAVGYLRVQANAVVCQGEVSAERGDLASARARHTQALALHERLGDTRGIAAGHNNLGLLAQGIGDNAEARRRFEAAFALHIADGRDDLAAINLVNLAGLATLEGDFASAQRAYRDALAKWRERRQWAETSEALRGLGQLEQRRGDYPAAFSAFAEAMTIVRRTGSLPDVLIVQQDLAATLAAMGNLQAALDSLRRAQVMAESAHVELDVHARIALGRADLAAQLNLQAEAGRLYAQSEALYRRAGDRLGEAEAQHGRALFLLEDSSAALATTLLRKALRAQLAAPDERAAAITRLALGSVLREQGDTAEARRHLVGASITLARLGDRVASAFALHERAALAVEVGARAAAESLFRAGLRELGTRAAPDVAWRLRAGLAGMHRARGDNDGAARELRTALVEIERPHRSLTAVERRSAFLADKWDVYGQLALVEHERGRAAAAFDASERLRSREMLELLERGRVAASPGTGTELWEREQDLRRRIAELTPHVGDESRSALRGPPERSERTTSANVAALAVAQSAYAELLLEMRERAPHASDLVSARAVSWRDVAARLTADEAMIEYLLSDSASLAFVVTRDTIRVIELAARRHDLVRLVEFARGTIDVPPASSTVARDDLWRGALRRLHAQLIAPLEEAAALRAKTRLVIVPHGELHYLPFAALVDERGRFLVERFEIAVTPSASVWLALGDRSIVRGTGMLALAPNTRALRGTQREVEAIDRGRSDAAVLRGASATESAFRREAPARRVIHLATYGVLNKLNPLFSFVELGRDAEHDGRLEVHEVFGMSLTADLVVLSACQTALSSGALADVPAGDDWVGLARAFLHAGAGNVAATLWPVDDWSSALLMERFYERFNAGADATASMAHAQRTLLRAAATAHPFYWAGFVVVRGDGGRRKS